MLDKSKQVHRPERLRGYDYSRPGCYFVTFNTRVRGEDILCKVVEGEKGADTLCKDAAKREAGTCLVGPDPLVRPIPPQLPDFHQSPLLQLTPAGEIVRELIENIPVVCGNAQVDCYVIMPDHVHLLIWLRGASSDGWEATGRDGLTRGSGPTGGVSLSQVVRALKSLSRKRVGYALWQERYYDHIIRSREELQSARQYIQNNPAKWLLDGK